jgi:hypothetical protein
MLPCNANPNDKATKPSRTPLLRKFRAALGYPLLARATEATKTKQMWQVDEKRSFWGINDNTYARANRISFFACMIVAFIFKGDEC